MPSFSMTPARITEPAVGASVWASGSQVCSGNSGTFTAKAMAKPRNSQRAVFVAISLACSAIVDEVEGEPAARRRLVQERQWPRCRPA